MSTDLFDRYATLDPVAEADSNVLDTADLLVAIDGRTTLMTTHDTIRPRSFRQPRRALLAAAGVAVAIVAVVGALLLVDLGGGESLPASPAPPAVTAAPALSAAEREALEIFERYHTAQNSRDVFTTMSLFTEDSVLNRNGVVLVGLDAIRDQHEVDFHVAAGSVAVDVSNIEVDGNTVTWDGRVETRDVGTWCTEGATMTIEGDAIVELSYSGSWVCAPSSGESLPAPMTEQEREVLAVLDAYVAAYNSRDVHGIVELFAEDATWIDWGLIQAEMVGWEAIGEAYGIVFNLTQGDQALTVSDAVVDGDRVTYDVVMHTRSFGPWCGSETITVRNGKIVRYDAGQGTSAGCT